MLSFLCPVWKANDKDPSIFLPLQTYLYLWERPGDCCTPVSLKEEFLVSMVVWKKAYVFTANSEHKQKGHTDFWVLTLTYHRVLPLPLLNLWNESYAGQSGSYFMITRYRKQWHFPMRKWWVQAFWAGNENIKSFPMCVIYNKYPSV